MVLSLIGTLSGYDSGVGTAATLPELSATIILFPKEPVAGSNSVALLVWKGNELNCLGIPEG